MTVDNVIVIADSQTPNDISEDVKFGWIRDVEGKIMADIYKVSEDELRLLLSGEDSLSLPDAFSSVYTLYLSAMIEFSKGNYDAFTKINAEFEKAFSSFAKYYIRNRK